MHGSLVGKICLDNFLADTGLTAVGEDADGQGLRPVQKAWTQHAAESTSCAGQQQAPERLAHVAKHPGDASTGARARCRCSDMHILLANAAAVRRASVFLG